MIFPSFDIWQSSDRHIWGEMGGFCQRDLIVQKGIMMVQARPQAFFLDRRHACVASVNDIFAHNPNAHEARRRCKDQWSPVITFYPRCYTHHQLPADQN